MSNLKDWADVPAKFKWRAFDLDGERWYFKDVPQQQADCWAAEDYEINDILHGGQMPAICPDWRETLEQRPNNL